MASLLSLPFVALLGAVPAANAMSEPAYCSTLSGSWDGTTNVCTFTGNYNLSTGTMEVTSGTSLTITDVGADGIYVASGATLTVDSGGTINVKNTGLFGDGIFNDGTLSNQGTINVKNSGTDNAGIIVRDGTFSNTGTINIDNSGNVGIDLESTLPIVAILTNFGTINIGNTGGGDGIFVAGGMINNQCSGTINIAASSDSVGLANEDIVNNYGTITGSVTNLNGGVTNDYSGSCTTHGVPQFPVGMPILFVLAVSLLLVMRMWSPALRKSVTS